MNGYILTYTPFDNTSRVHLNHTLFGRLMHIKYKDKKYVYYIPGMLDNVLYTRIKRCKIFVSTLTDVNLEELRIFGDIIVQEKDEDIPEEELMNGKDFWFAHGKEKGLVVKRKKNGRR